MIKKKDIVEMELRKEPLAPSRRIARYLVGKYPDLFPSVETARIHVRLIRGTSGSKRNKPIKDLMVTSEQTAMWEKINCQKTRFKTYQISDECKKYLLLYDIHSPYHIPRHLDLAVRWGKDFGCDGIIYGGDIADFYQASYFLKDPTKPKLKYEVESVKDILDTAERIIEPVKTYFIEGNHERRLPMAFMSKMPELFDQIRGVNLDRLFEFDKFGIQMIPNGNPLKYKALTLLHGNELRNSVISPVNAARGVFLKTKACTVVGHFHTTSEHTEPDINGKITTCWSVGCLCDLHPEFQPFNKWNHGFGVLEICKGDIWKMHNKRIVKGDVV